MANPIEEKARIASGLPAVRVTIDRDPRSYQTMDGQHKELRGLDTMTFTNITTNKTVSIPVSSVANMAGSAMILTNE